MKELSISDYRDVELRILGRIHDFCEAKGITYFLYYGSLLGALRHGGPIPWDDDIDIAMPRPDYDRFLREFVDTDEYRLVACERGNSRFRVARVCDTKYTVVKTKMPVVCGNDSVGVWVDVFPLDGVYGDDNLDLAREEKIIVMRTRMNHARDPLMRVLRQQSSVYWRCRQLLISLVARLLFPLMYRRFVRVVKALEYGSTGFCGAIVNLGYPGRETMRESWFSSRRLVDFASMKVYVPCGAEQILEHMYGDWHTPPPVEERTAASHFLSVLPRDGGDC